MIKPVTEADIWERAGHLEFANEAEVETKLLFPLLTALGFAHDTIKPKVPVVAYPPAKKTGRKTEADFVVYAEPPYDRTTSLLTAELKHPHEELAGAKTQAEYYAFWSGTPLYLLTNGRHIEIWQFQTARECNLVFTCPVAKLAEHRGQLESLLSPSSLTTLCDQLAIKKIEVAKVDLSAYLKSIEHIFDNTDETIRKFVTHDSSDRRRLDEIDLLREDGSHIIVGESGSGKTTLLKRLLGRAVSRRVHNEDARVPAYAYLPHVIALEVDLESFLRGEFAAHQERVRSQAAFRELLKTGLILFADAFDRVRVGPAQERLEAQLSAFLRAYPKTKLLLATRPGVEPRLDRVQLQRLLPLETADVIRIAADDHGLSPEVAPRFYGSLPHYLRSIAHNPFFLEHLVRAYREHKRVPNNLNTLFEGWLASVLQSITDDTASRPRLLDVLAILAILTVQGPASPFDVYALFEARDLPPRYIDALVGTGLIQRGAGGVELEHEIVADYLRAKQLPESFESDELGTRLVELGAGKGSSLLAFAMARAQSSEDCRRLWSLVAKLSVRTYLDALHSIPSHTLPPEHERREWIAEEILSGYEDLATHQFSALAPHLPGFQNSAEIRIETFVAKDVSEVRYGYHPRKHNEPRIQLILAPSLDKHHFQYGRNLQIRDFRPEAARSLGVDDLYSDLKRIIDNRVFRGGPRWARERLMARLSQLEDIDGEFSVRVVDAGRITDRLTDLIEEGSYLTMTVTELQLRFEPHVEMEIGTGFGAETEWISLDEVNGDLAALVEMGAGHERPCDWALPSGDLPPPEDWPYYWGQVYSDARMIHLIETIENRVDEAYREVVEASFPGLESQLPHASVMPTMRQLFVTRSQDRSRASIDYWWRPVENWTEHRLEVTMDPPPAASDFEDLFNQVSLELRQLGRPYQYAGWYRSVAHIRAMSQSDTIVMERVAEMLLKDLKTLFRRTF
jgi:hypothetical protein